MTIPKEQEHPFSLRAFDPNSVRDRIEAYLSQNVPLEEKAEQALKLFLGKEKTTREQTKSLVE